MPLARLIQEDFSVGMERDVAPHLIDARGLFSAVNGLHNDDGSIYKRGGSVAHSSGPFGSSGRGVWDGWLQPGRRTLIASSSALGVLAADDKTPISLGGSGFGVPKVAREIEGMLFIGGGKIYGGSRKEADYSTGTVTTTKDSRTVTGAGTAFLANVDIGMLFRTGAAERVYVVSSVDTDTQLTLRDPYEGKTEVGRAYTLKRLEDATAPYKTCDFYAVVSRRLLVNLGNEVWFSEPGKPHVYQAKIEPSGTLVDNRHVIDEGARLVGQEGIGTERAMIFTTEGITAISNLSHAIVDSLGETQHRVDQFSRDIVLWGNAGITGWRDALVVPGTEDVYVMDGTSEPTPISRSIRPLYRQYVKEGYAPGRARVFRDHYFLPILDATGAPLDCLVCRLDRPTTVRGQRCWPWSFMRDSGARISAVEVRTPSAPGEAPKLLAASFDGRLLNLTPFFEPSAEVKLDHDGTVPRFELITRDNGADNLAIVRWRRVRARYEMEVDEGDEAWLHVDIGSGLRLENQAQWDETKWDEFKWSDDSTIQFLELEEPGPAPPNSGMAAILAQNAWEWFAAERLRFCRLRLRTTDPVAKLTIRGLEIFYAETGGVRHSKVT